MFTYQTSTSHAGPDLAGGGPGPGAPAPPPLKSGPGEWP